MVGGFDPYTGGVPLTFQSDPGVALDSVGHSVVSAITGNSIFDFTNVYESFDTEIEVAVGYANGTYTSLLPTVVDFHPCNFSALASTCAIQLDKPLVTIDNVPGSRTTAPFRFITSPSAFNPHLAPTGMLRSCRSPPRSWKRTLLAQGSPSPPPTW